MSIERLLLRMAIWIRRPPSRRRIMMVVVIGALGLAIVGIERYVGWPDWARLEPKPSIPHRIM
ncbi:hypothetical protein [Methylobrevis albus]|uniref:Uncharacterized protein n=1 Tax=Methylobrevis albus TaxID=2793297 RepID=A0A931I1V9_9HYPH|nr:hypothetical protein [Methylobrevis albus]MBH0238742.1 hypothetical protein [Methylobrevis albus]